MRKSRLVLLILLLLVLAGGAYASNHPRVVGLWPGDVMAVECAGGALPVEVLDGPGKSKIVVCRR